MLKAILFILFIVLLSIGIAVFCIVLGTLEPKKVFEITYYTEDYKRLNILVTARSAAGAVKQFYKLKGRTNSIHYIEEARHD